MKSVLNPFNTSSPQRAKNNINALNLLSLKFLQKEAPNLLKLFTKERGTNEVKESPHSEKGTQCSNWDKNQRIRTSQLNSKGLVARVPSSFIFSHHIPTPLVAQPIHVERKAFLAPKNDGKHVVPRQIKMNDA